MKRFILLLTFVALFAGNVSFGQNNAAKADDFGRIVITPYIDDSYTAIPHAAYGLLKNKLNQIAVNNGIGGNIQHRFIITANAAELTKDITATTPPMHAVTLEVTFYIGDGVEGTLFSTTSMTVKGVGETEDKAYIAALKSIKTKSPVYAKFVDTGKTKIIEYYNANGDMYITTARALAKEERYDEAIYMLMCIPEVCKDVYVKAMDEVEIIYKSKIDSESSKSLAEAKAIWASGMDYYSAEKAAKLLAKVHPNSTSYKAAVTLSNDIAKRVKEIDSREWQYALAEQKYDHSEKLAQLQSFKEIALTSAKNQPKENYYIRWW